MKIGIMHVTTTPNMQLIIKMSEIIHVHEEGECFAPLLPLGKVLQVENRGVLHSVWPGPLWTDFSPIKSRSRKEWRDGSALLFGALSHGDLDFFMDRPEGLVFFTFWYRHDF